MSEPMSPQHGAQLKAERRTGGFQQRRRKRDNSIMVPDATFTSYYGRPVVKASPWEADIPAYLFLGGLAAGSSLLGAGAQLTGRPGLRRVGRLGALGAISISFAALVHDLGRPSRFLNMLRVAKVTSPMSVGTWLLSGYAPLAGAAAAAELADLLPLPRALRGPARVVSALAPAAGFGAALVAPAIASYTGVLLADTATPTWHGARRELPFVFVSSAAAAAGGLGMALCDKAEAGPARRLALGGAIAELAVSEKMRASLGVAGEPLEQGRAGRLLTASRALTAGGAIGSLLSRRSRAVGVASGLALLAGSALTRFGIFEAGQASARDPRYTVVPQRERIERGESAGA